MTTSEILRCVEKLLETGNQERALSLLNRTLKSTSDAGAIHYKIGQILFEKRLYFQAYEYWISASAMVRPRNPLPKELTSIRNCYDQFKKNIGFASEGEGENGNPLNEASGLAFNRGNFFSLAGKLARAYQDYLFCIKNDKTYYGGYFGLACLFLLISGSDALRPQALSQALDFVSASISFDPSPWRSNLLAGYILYATRDRNCIRHFLEALKYRPADRELLLTLSYATFWLAKEYDRAVEYFEQAASLDPYDFDAYEESYFYSVYLDGPVPKSVENLYAKRNSLLAKSVKAFGIDRLAFRTMAGIAPYIGHYAYLDVAIKAMKLGLIPERQIVILSLEEKIVNKALMKLWEQYVVVITEPFVMEVLSRISNYTELDFTCIPDFFTKPGNDNFKLAGIIQKRWEAEARTPLLALSEEQRQRGWDCLESMGVPRGAWVVALHVRDDGYTGPNASHGLRNAEIGTYAKAIAAITTQGGWVIRIGDPKMKPLPELYHAVDYAHSSFKADWMDVFLWSESRFFIGVNSGPSWITTSFGTPCARTNWSPVTRVHWSGHDVMIPKLFWKNNEKRYLTFSEMLDPNGAVGWVHSDKTIIENGLSPVDNTPEELEELVSEMIARTSGSIEYTADDERMQNEFIELASRVCSTGNYSDLPIRIGRDFLRRHKNLLT